MIVVTASAIAGKKISKTLGMVKGNTIRARAIGRDITAALKQLVGGEIAEYTKLMAEAREQSVDRMIANALELGGNAITDVRFSTSEVMANAAEIVVYGTAVILEDDGE
jgi:uncharacterized protein YbjQ (UPF0145 family)